MELLGGDPLTPRLLQRRRGPHALLQRGPPLDGPDAEAEPFVAIVRERREAEALVDAALLDGGGAKADSVVPAIAQLGELAELGIDIEGRVPFLERDLGSR